MNLGSISFVNATNPCENEQFYLNICESPCVTQVGLSILRVTFNSFFVDSEWKKTDMKMFEIVGVCLFDLNSYI